MEANNGVRIIAGDVFIPRDLSLVGRESDYRRAIECFREMAIDLNLNIPTGDVPADDDFPTEVLWRRGQNGRQVTDRIRDISNDILYREIDCYASRVLMPLHGRTPEGIPVFAAKSILVGPVYEDGDARKNNYISELNITNLVVEALGLATGAFNTWKQTVSIMADIERESIKALLLQAVRVTKVLDLKGVNLITTKQGGELPSQKYRELFLSS